jgi:hypothetical protein
VPKPKATPPSELGNYSTKAAASDNLAYQSKKTTELQENTAKSLEETYITIKPGLRLPISTFVDHNYVQRKGESLFPDGKDIVKDPTPGAEYGWPVKNDPMLFGRLRSKAYRLVGPDEIREDSSAPVSTCKMADEEGVQVMNHVLVEIAPRFVQQLYKDREAQAALQLHGHLGFKELQGNIAKVSNGTVSAEAVVRTEDGSFELK